jgi:tight adherence protein C
MDPFIIALILIGAAAIVVGGYALASMVRRREVLQRATGVHEAPVETLVLLPESGDGRLASLLVPFAPASADTAAVRAKLLQAGFESPTAPQVYYMLRTISFVVFPVLSYLIAPKSPELVFLAALAVGLYLGFILPLAMLDRLARLRQERIRRSVPDALDLLVVCVEAGTSLDSAILRVSKELRFLHPDLAHEMAIVNRVINAGMVRERALRGLFERTGVPELRSLVSSMVQSEKLGTSIAMVLRVSSDTLRRRRRQAAEKQAKQAPLKMTIPLVLFILPALFAVILGPAIILVVTELRKV